MPDAARWLLAAALLLPGAAALAEGVFPTGLRVADRERLARFDAARDEALAAARFGGGSGEREQGQREQQTEAEDRCSQQRAPTAGRSRRRGCTVDTAMWRVFGGAPVP